MSAADRQLEHTLRLSLEKVLMVERLAKFEYKRQVDEANMKLLQAALDIQIQQAELQKREAVDASKVIACYCSHVTSS